MGLFTALHLQQQDYPYPVILIDQNDRFVFKPLLYEYLSSEMDDFQVCPRYEELLPEKGIKFVSDTVEQINLPQKTVTLKSGQTYAYHNLVLALGSCSSFLGIEGAKDHTFTFRTRQDAIALKQHLHQCLEQASYTSDAQKRRILLTFAIVGAGPSGVELTATLADMLPKWYSQWGGDFLEIRLVLLNRSGEILKGDINHHLRQAAKTALTHKTVSVELRLNASVTQVDPYQLQYQRHDQTETLKAATLIWTTGTKIHPLIDSLAIPDSHKSQKGRLKVAPTLQLPHFPEVFAGGDCAADLQHPLPPTAQVAYQQGAAIAHNLNALAHNKRPNHAEIHLRGSLLKLGLEEGAANLFEQFVMTGKSAHLIRQGTYLTLLPTSWRDFQATGEWLSEEIFQNAL